ncbi:dihydrodipicolinate synthase family protein [Schlesneria sp. T3-172]|uniref:dihydrodipicolinate synthase family protein n=1 Tax=Schlesneria sphaerica TaxID=3373610 RepID=UPI0037C51DCB
MVSVDPLNLVQPRRKITGVSAILLPFTEAGEVDWLAFDQHVSRTVEAGLIPAVNMDTGYVNLIDDSTRNYVLNRTHDILAGLPFVAGAFVADREGDAFQCDAYLQQIEFIEDRGGLPIVFQSYGLTRQSSERIVESYAQLASACDRFLAFELTTSLAPFGAIYDLPTFEGVMSIPQCVGVKHSSFRREPEWERLQLRNESRPDFVIFTGNDFAIDMVMYGSDYLLGLSTFAPDLFAMRDKFWENGDRRFYELNDQLQYLGHFAFRHPSPGYKHSAAQFLHLRGWIGTDLTHPFSVQRPSSDTEILQEIQVRLEQFVAEVSA